jgi:hypothetical protein
MRPRDGLVLRQATGTWMQIRYAHLSFTNSRCGVLVVLLQTCLMRSEINVTLYKSLICITGNYITAFSHNILNHSVHDYHGEAA